MSADPRYTVAAQWNASCTADGRSPLSTDQTQSFVEDGVLVVPGVLNQEELKDAQEGLKSTLREHGVDTNNLTETGQHLRELSSTNGSGGVLDLFYDAWKMRVATNPKLFAITKQLWKNSYCWQGEPQSEVGEDVFRWHPYGPFDPDKGYAYIDRIGYRIPSTMAEYLSIAASRNGKPISIQRSLTPHLDCCPDSPFGKAKWRPIQCFVSLTDNAMPDTGGFECHRSFHRSFHIWAANRPPTVIKKKSGDDATFKAPCVGEYSHIRPIEDRVVMENIRHVSVPAGAAVFWDTRIPHANSYRHAGAIPRCVVYCSFLPDVCINHTYVSHQLERWKAGNAPTDQWVRQDGVSLSGALSNFDRLLPTWSADQRKLLGIEPW